MITFRVSAEVGEDRQLVLTLPAEVPTGQVELSVTIEDQARVSPNTRRSSLADWADEQAEHWGSDLDSTAVERFTGREF